MRITWFLPAVALAVAVAACDGTGTSPSGRGNTTFRLSQAGSGASASLIALDENGGGGGGARGRHSLSLSDIKSIDIRFTGVAALPKLHTDTANEVEWVTFPAAHPVEVNLLQLPTTMATALLLERDNLPPGTYGNLRVLFDQATITFANAVTLAEGNNVRTFAADSTYPLCIGGFPRDTLMMTEKDADDSNHFGIFVPNTTINVGTDTTSTVDLVFNTGATVQRVFVTPRCIRMVPVIRSVSTDEEGNEHEGGND